MGKRKAKTEIAEVIDFAYKMSKAMKEIGSSHVYFIMQQALDKNPNNPQLSWEECEEMWDGIIATVEALRSQKPFKLK